MRAAFWLIGLFGVAVACALLAAGNQSTVSIFWSPYRIDLSLNFALVLLTGLFAVLYWALRAISAMMELPHQARRWRMMNKERAMHAAFLDSVSQLLTGRFLRSVKSAQKTLELHKSLNVQLKEHEQQLGHLSHLEVLSHLIVAESAHALSDQNLRQQHFDAALNLSNTPIHSAQTLEAVLLRAARWALRERQPQKALQWLSQLPQGASRRTLALRLRLKAARLDEQNLLALETARLLSKHGAFSVKAAQSLLGELCIALFQKAQDASQLEKAWSSLDKQEQQIVDVALFAVRRLEQLDGTSQPILDWLLPLWNRLLKNPDTFTLVQRHRLISMLSQTLLNASRDHDWLTSIEHARTAYPNWADLQYLAGIICYKHELWGKSQQMLEASLHHLQDMGMQRHAIVILAQLAELKGDSARSQVLWRRAAQILNN
jgi:HemY protein